MGDPNKRIKPNMVGPYTIGHRNRLAREAEKKREAEIQQEAAEEFKKYAHIYGPLSAFQPGPSCAFEESILSERANLINNPDVFSDVTFVLGSDETEVTAHKAFLVSASEVFKAMFSKNFAIDAKIKVADLEVEVFTQVLRYCYSLKATITEENMLSILYGAEKYMLPGLMAQGVVYVLERMNETNCLEIFNSTHLLNCPAVNEKCLAHFQENPWKFFTDATFHKLSLSALKKLAGLSVMNCTGPDMKAAVLEWFVANGHCESVKDVDDKELKRQGFAANNFFSKKFYNLTRGGSHVMAKRSFQSITTKMNFSPQMSLSGVGLCAGILERNDAELVKLTISQGKTVVYSVLRSVKKSPSFAIAEVLFEKAVTLSGTVAINVEFSANLLRSVITNSVCLASEHYLKFGDETDGHENKCTKMWSADVNAPYTCLAYLIFKK